MNYNNNNNMVAYKRIFDELTSVNSSVDTLFPSSRDDGKRSKDAKNLFKDESENRKKRRSSNELDGIIKNLMGMLENLRNESMHGEQAPIPDQITIETESMQDTTLSFDFDDSLDNELTASKTKTNPLPSSGSIYNTEFYKEIIRRDDSSLSDEESFTSNTSAMTEDDSDTSSEMTEDESAATVASRFEDFDAFFGPNDMRCLALVCDKEMKTTMRDFVVRHRHVLKKFRLTGTQGTMKMLGDLFINDPDIVFGPSLGSDAELVQLMAYGELGGVFFFRDPAVAHPHEADIECLVRQALVQNTIIATNPTTATVIMELFRSALKGEGRPDLIPSFFFSPQSPVVDSYKRAQRKVLRRNSSVSSTSSFRDIPQRQHISMSSLLSNDTVHTYSSEPTLHCSNNENRLLKECSHSL